MLGLLRKKLLDSDLMLIFIWLENTKLSSSFYVFQLDHPLEGSRRIIFVKKKLRKSFFQCSYASSVFEAHDKAFLKEKIMPMKRLISTHPIFNYLLMRK